MIKAMQQRPKKSTTFDQQIGARIRQVRKKQKMSQEQLGKEVGVSFQQIQKYENGHNRISASRLVHVARILNVSTNFFLDQAEPGVPAMTIEGIRREFDEGMRHMRNVGEAIGLDRAARQAAVA